MSHARKTPLAEVYVDEIRQYPVPFPEESVLKMDLLDSNSANHFECYELSLHSNDQTIGEIKVRLYIDKGSLFSCNPRFFCKQVEPFLHQKDDPSLDTESCNGAFARIIVQNSQVFQTGFYGHCMVSGTDLSYSAMFGGSIDNLELLYGNDMKAPKYKYMTFSTSYITNCEFSPHGQVWNSSIVDSDITVTHSCSEEDDKEDYAYFLNGVTASHFYLDGSDADCKPCVVISSELNEVSIEYRQTLYMENQRLTNMNLVGNTFKLVSRLSVFTINLPKGDLLVSNNAKDNWNVFATLNERGWMITDTGDDEFENHLRNMLQLAGEHHVDSCIQYTKDSLVSRRKLIEKIKANEYLRLSAVC